LIDNNQLHHKEAVLGFFIIYFLKNLAFWQIMAFWVFLANFSFFGKYLDFLEKKN
jgi:hypothetical protein